MLPPLVRMVLTLALVGLLVWVVIRYVPMPEAFQKLIVAVAVIASLLWFLQWIGLFA